MAFTDFLCLFGKEGRGRARPGGMPGEAGRDAGRSTQADPHSYTKKLWAGAYAPARSRLIKTSVLISSQLS